MTDLPGILRIGEKRFQQGLRAQVGYVQVVIVNNIGLIVELPGSLKAVGINKKHQKKKQNKGNHSLFDI